MPTKELSKNHLTKKKKKKKKERERERERGEREVRRRKEKNILQVNTQFVWFSHTKSVNNNKKKIKNK